MGHALLDLGCGAKKAPGALGLDRFPFPGVDVLADLEEGLPFRDNTFDEVRAVHVLEHVHNVVHLMNELHRVLKPGGVLRALTPYWRHANAIIDPTHVRFFCKRSFLLYCDPAAAAGVSLSGVRARFRPLRLEETDDTVFADLQALKDGTEPAAPPARAAGPSRGAGARLRVRLRRDAAGSCSWEIEAEGGDPDALARRLAELDARLRERFGPAG
ncbi:MAG TPA: class I SAM-dependent methyltransferase [Dehalococcoidia bacterium]